MNDTGRYESQAWEVSAARLALSIGTADASAHCQASESLEDSGKRLVDFLARNSFPFLGIPESHTLSQTAESSRARAGEAADFARLRAEFEIVRREWESHGIECLMLKSAGMPPDFPYRSGNLDVLVAPGQGSAARSLLRQLGYVELRNCEEPNKFLFRRFRDGNAVCDVHVHLRIEWRVSFLFEERVWDRRQRSKDDPCLFVPSPEDALLINLAHSFFENKSVGLYDLKKVEHCLRSPGLEWSYIWEVADAKGWSAGLATALLVHDHLVSLPLGRSCVSCDQIDEAWLRLGRARRRSVARLLAKPYSMPFPIGFIFSKRLFVQKILADRSEAPRDRLRDLFLHFTTGTRLKLGLRSQPGFLVAVSGVDGAGKTTQARSLLRALDRCEIRTKYIWSRPGSSLLSYRLVTLARILVPGLRHSWRETAGQGPKDSGRGVNGPGFDPGSRWHRAAWLLLVLLDCAIVYGVRVRFSLLTGHVVICDRFLPDAFADLASRFRDERAANHALLRCVGVICPKPDFPVLLQVDPEQACCRRDREARSTITESDRSQARLLEAFAHRDRIPILDASRDTESVSDQLVFRSLTRYFAGYRTLLNMVFFANPRSAPDGEGTPPEGRA